MKPYETHRRQTGDTDGVFRIHKRADTIHYHVYVCMMLMHPLYYAADALGDDIDDIIGEL